MIAGPSLVALYFYHQVLAKAHRYGVITGKGYRPRDIELGRFKFLGLGFIVLYLLLAVVLPMLVLTWTSFLPLIQMPSVKALSKLSFENYRSFMEFIGGQDVIQNTVILLISVSVLALFFSLMISWIVVRTRIRVRNTMDTIAMLPHAFPGLAFAFALFMVAILASVWFPSIPIGGTLGIIVLANLLNRLSYTTRITNASLLQVTPELEESARVCGAGNIPTMWSIIMPLIRPSLVFAGLWTALLTFREVSMALFLTETNNLVLSVAVWELWDSGQLGEASAAAVVMVSAMGLLLLTTLAFTGGRLTQRGGF
jgi:iron(III) transport system permease protein